jgi:lipopolysaccharide transport system ATP-binding protein
MSEPAAVAVRLRDVSKSYTVYAKPRYWLADFLGLGRFLREGRHYRSFWALRDIDLEIPRGGRIALVGRNGAGKSTLLRIISENIAPTTGTVEVHGRCEALMQLGTGFNPEFTGRANVFSALAYMGVTGKKAEEKLQDILDFSELDEFIDQPVRTYSSGMYLRLAFTVATVIAPEILIIDEVLAAGDMYFQSKCLARIGELTSGPGTTVIFVSHSLEAAERICNTFVWIDRGRIVGQGPSHEVRAAYEDSIRRQQDLRMRARNMRLSQRSLAALQAAEKDGSHLLGQLVLDASDSKAVGPHIDAIRLHVRGKLAEEIHVGDAMDDNAGPYPSFVLSDPAGSSWSPPVRRDGHLTRAVRRQGGPATGAKFALFLHYDDFADPGYELSLEVAYQDSSRIPCQIELNAGTAGLIGVLSLQHEGDDGWKTARAVISRWIYSGLHSQDSTVARRPAAEIPATKRFGTGQVLIDRVQFLGETGEETYVLRHGRPMTIAVWYHADDPGVIGGTMVCAAGFEATDGLQVSAMISAAEDRVFVIHPAGCIRLKLWPLLLSNGTYRFSVGLFSKMDLHGLDPHFTASPFLFSLLARAHEFVVEGANPAESWIFRHPVSWEGDASP